MKNSNIKTVLICLSALILASLLFYGLYNSSHNMKKNKIETISFGWQGVFR